MSRPRGRGPPPEGVWKRREGPSRRVAPLRSAPCLPRGRAHPSPRAEQPHSDRKCRYLAAAAPSSRGLRCALDRRPGRRPGNQVTDTRRWRASPRPRRVRVTRRSPTRTGRPSPPQSCCRDGTGYLTSQLPRVPVGQRTNSGASLERHRLVGRARAGSVDRRVPGRNADAEPRDHHRSRRGRARESARAGRGRRRRHQLTNFTHSHPRCAAVPNTHRRRTPAE